MAALLILIGRVVALVDPSDGLPHPARPAASQLDRASAILDLTL